MPLGSRTILFALACAAASLALAPASIAQVSGSVRVETPGVRLTFAPKEATVIREYYVEQSQGGKEKKQKKEKKEKKEKELPPGLQKKLDRGEALPPGLQKRLDRGDSLPPGLAKRRLPADLESKLQPLPTGYKRYVVGPDIVLVDERRNVVVDIMVNIALQP